MLESQSDNYNFDDQELIVRVRTPDLAITTEASQHAAPKISISFPPRRDEAAHLITGPLDVPSNESAAIQDGVCHPRI